MSNIEGFPSPSMLIYGDNQKIIKNYNLNLKFNLQTNNSLTLTIKLSRELVVTYDGYVGWDIIVSQSISRTSLFNNSTIDVHLNWEKTNIIIATIINITNSESNKILVYTSPRIYIMNPIQIDTTFNPVIKNYTVNFVRVSISGSNNTNQWKSWGRIESEYSWNSTNDSIKPNLILMEGNNGVSSFSTQIDSEPITKTTNTQTPFDIDFFIITLIIITITKRKIH